MARLSLSLLGPFQAILDGQPLDSFRTDSARGLLVYLATQPGDLFHRDHLAALLWPDSLQEEARINLRQTLYRLRQALGDTAGDFLLSADRALSFNLESDYWLDVHEFTDLLDRCDSHPHRTLNACTPCIERLRQAIELYRGNFLNSFSLASPAFEEWRVLLQESFHNRALDALSVLAFYHRRRQEYDQAADALRRILALEPWREEAHVRLMRVLALSGQRSAALAQYEICRRMLEQELGALPSPQTDELHRAIESGTLTPEQIEDTNPYKGLDAFTQSDASDFYGRETYIRRLQTVVYQGGLVALIGASGSGKSSLLEAGLFPELTATNGKEERWRIVVLRPGSRPTESLAHVLAQHLSVRRLARLGNSVDELAQRLAAGSLSLADIVGEMLRNSGKERLLLIIDQFEEMYTLCPDEKSCQSFIDLLVASGPTSRLSVLLSVRADFAHHTISQRALADAIQARGVVLGPMNREELRRAIEEPARNRGVFLESGLTERLLHDLGDRAGSLPLLQFTLTALWQERSGHHLTHDAYEMIGQLGGALINYTEDIYSRLTARQQQAARLIFLRLVRLGTTSPDTRRQAQREEFDDEQWAVVGQLADNRLLVTNRDDTDQETVELAHEILIENWPRLAGWLHADRAFFLWREGLRSSMRLWERSGQDDGALLRGGPLAEAEGRVAERWDDLTAAEQHFIHASQALRLEMESAEAAQRQRERRHARDLAAALESRTQALTLAQRAAALAESHSLGSAAQLALFQSDSGKALGLARQAVQIDDPPAEARLMLADAAYAPGCRRILFGHKAAVHGVAFHPDQRRAVSAGADSSLLLWDLASGQPLHRFLGHAGAVYAVDVGPDGRRLLSASADGALILWEVETGAVLQRLSGHAEAVRQARFLPDGNAALSAGDDGCLLLWDLTTGSVRARWQEHSQPVHALAVSPNGQAALSGDAQGTIIHWALPDGRVLHRFPGLPERRQESGPLDCHFEAVAGIGFVGDGSQAVSASVDQFAIHWNLASGTLMAKRAPVKTGLHALASAPDGRSILLGSLGSEVVVLDMESGDVTRLPGHRGRVFAVAYSGDGRRALSGSADGAVYYWDLCSGAELHRWEFPSTDKAVASLAIRGDEQMAAVGMFDGDISLRSLPDWQELRRLRGHTEMVYAGVRFLPDGQQLLSASGNIFIPESDFSLRLWDVKRGVELRRFAGHTDKIWDMDLSPDGAFAVSASHDGTVRRWEIESGGGWILHRVDPQAVLCVAISPDATRILVGLGKGSSISPDYSLRLLDSSTGDEVGRLVGHSEVLGDVTFSPDGRLALSGSQERRIFLWDVASGEQVGELTGATSGVMRLAFSPDGALAAMGGTAGELLLWDVASRALIRRYTGHRRIVTQVLFSGDGERIYSADDDHTANQWRGTVREWRVDRDLAALLAWTRENRQA